MKLWLHPAPLLLASGSVTRADLLRAAGLPFTTEKPAVDERAIEAGFAGPVTGLAAALAAAKAREVSARRPGRVTLGADQTLDLEGELFHKPAGMAEARAALSRLSGRTHRLISAFALALDGDVVATGADAAAMAMRSVDPAFLDAYLALTGERVLASVGAYQLEGTGIHLFDRVEGAHATVLGLPLQPLLAALRRHGWLAG